MHRRVGMGVGVLCQVRCGAACLLGLGRAFCIMNCMCVFWVRGGIVSSGMRRL